MIAATRASTRAAGGFLQVSVPTLAPGIYSVHWVVLSIGGHRTTGDFRFTVKSAQ